MVRFKAEKRHPRMEKFASFNSYMVRFKDEETVNIEYAYDSLSIPIWFDLKDVLNTGGAVDEDFQFLYGSI